MRPMLAVIVGMIGLTLLLIPLLTPSPLSEKQIEANGRRAVDDFYQCFVREYPREKYVSTDGDRSTVKLLAKCLDEWSAVSEACQTDTGDSEANCDRTTSQSARAFILLKEMGREPRPPDIESLR